MLSRHSKGVSTGCVDAEGAGHPRAARAQVGGWIASQCPTQHKFAHLPTCLPGLPLLPHLPTPACCICRYSPALAMLGDGRLHVFGGLLPDRSTPAREHWSLGVKAGEMPAAFSWLGSMWPPLPCGRPPLALR